MRRIKLWSRACEWEFSKISKLLELKYSDSRENGRPRRMSEKTAFFCEMAAVKMIRAFFPLRIQSPPGATAKKGSIHGGILSSFHQKSGLFFGESGMLFPFARASVSSMGSVRSVPGGTVAFRRGEVSRLQGWSPCLEAQAHGIRIFQRNARLRRAQEPQGMPVSALADFFKRPFHENSPYLFLAQAGFRAHVFQKLPYFIKPGFNSHVLQKFAHPGEFVIRRGCELILPIAPYLDNASYHISSYHISIALIPVLVNSRINKPLPHREK